MKIFSNSFVPADYHTCVVVYNHCLRNIFKVLNKPFISDYLSFRQVGIVGAWKIKIKKYE